MNNKLFAALSVAVTALGLHTTYAQSPTPIVAKGGTQTVAVSVVPEAKSDSMEATMKSLREIKAANEQILKQQQATLEALNELQKAADQIKIFSKRG
jgi:predicted PhzF superfamily epimerase YddE/YHI9